VPVQILRGSDYKLRTFGYSLSGGLDLDGNSYPDLIIGIIEKVYITIYELKM
jgi:integrin alpha 7